MLGRKLEVKLFINCPLPPYGRNIWVVAARKHKGQIARMYCFLNYLTLSEKAQLVGFSNKVVLLLTKEENTPDQKERIWYET